MWCLMVDTADRHTLRDGQIRLEHHDTDTAADRVEHSMWDRELARISEMDSDRWTNAFNYGDCIPIREQLIE